jgi:hypothetical protein
VVRNVGYYHYHITIGFIPARYPLERYVGRFVAGALDPFGSWEENIRSWLDTRHHTPGFLLVRYEDMVDHPVRALATIASFLAIDAPAAQLESAVRQSAAQTVQQEHYVVRSGKAGGWKTALPEVCVREMVSVWGSVMDRLGYKT